MAFKHGKDTEVWLHDIDLTSFLNSLDLKADTDTAETSTFGNDWKKFIPGQSGAVVDFAGLYDPDQTSVNDTLTASAGSLLTHGPAGMVAEGDAARLMTILATAYGESAAVGGVVAFKWSVLADGSLGFGVCLHPLAQAASASNGSGVDGGASSANGGFAHLHVTAITDDLDVTIEDSADGSTDWQTIATFTTASAVGSERQAIAGTIRRHVRATWDPNAGTATFGVALARL